MTDRDIGPWQPIASNKRNNLVIDGLCLAAWMERAIVSRRTVSRRLAAGWPIERAISETDGRLK